MKKKKCALWHSVENKKPPVEMPVLVIVQGACEEYKKIYIAFYENGKRTTSKSDYLWDEDYLPGDFCYNEETDDYIIPEGWYYSTVIGEVISRLDELWLSVTHWTKAPKIP